MPCVICSSPCKRPQDKTCGPTCRAEAQRVQGRKDKAKARDAARAAGLCVVCQQRPMGDRRMCGPCRDRARLNAQRRHERARTEGLCLQCGIRPRQKPVRSRTSTGSVLCLVCTSRGRKPGPLLRKMCASAKARAKRRGMEWTIDVEALVEDVLARPSCGVSNIPFVFDVPGSPWAPSLDRIDSRIGYTRNNVQVVCWLYNQAKNVYSEADVLRLAMAISRAHD